MIKVLFVDDDIRMLDGLRRALIDYADKITPIFSNSAEKALVILDGEPMDVVVTDMAMPGMDGKSLIVEIYNKFPNIVPIVLSGHWNSSISEQNLGPHIDFFSKPVKAEKLLDTIISSFVLTKLASASLSDIGLTNT